MIVAEGLTRFYGKFEAVSDISFTASSGEIVGLLGQNGAGKSTIMNMLAGSLSPTSGRVYIKRKDLARHPESAKGELGFLPETPPLYPELTVVEYLRFCCRLKRVAKADEKRHLDEIMELAGIADVATQVIGSLSRGYRQRAGLAQALCGNPGILLLDEPTAGFDPRQAVEFRKLIKKLSRDKTILFSSHLLSEVQEICDRVLIVHQGKLIMDHAMYQDSSCASFRLQVQGSPARVLPPLRQLSSVQRVKQLGDGKAETTKVLVQTCRDQAFPAQLFTLLSSLNTPILELSPIQDDLEALFLRVTAQSGGSFS